MYDTPRTTEEIMSMLADGPRRIAEITAGLSAAQLVTTPENGGWSARDVLAHLRACADMWGMYIDVILAKDRPTYKAVNPTTWIKQTNYLELEFQPSLEAYTAQRLELLQVLGRLRPEDWQRTATAITAGRPRQRTVYTYGQWLANHEKQHLKQIEALVKKQESTYEEP